jgi:hypothetical protein
MTLTEPTPQTWNGSALGAPAQRWSGLAQRRRWSLIAVIAAACLAVMGLVYERAVTADTLSFSGAANVWRVDALDRAGVAEVHNALGTDVSVGFLRNGPFVVHLGLVNGGRHDVRIRSIPKERAFYYRLEGVETSEQQFNGFRPFRPFTLHAGETRWMALHFRFADCDLSSGPGLHSSRTSLRVRYSVLGFPRSRFVPFDEIAVTVPAGNCDQPAS